VADTISVPQITTPLAAKPIDPPTLSVTFRINDGPLAGREGDKVQSRVIRERLMREAEGNVAIRVTPGDDNDSFDVAGRGELQLAVLIENMRREGFELTIGRPKVLFKEENGQKLEPIEEVIIDVDDEHTGAVVQKLTERKGELTDMRPSGVGRTRIILLVPTRSLIGYQAELLSDTRGTAIFNRLFHSFVPFKGDLPTRRTGVLISNGTGQSVAFALWNLEDRGPIMIDAGVDIYEGMIVGEHSRENDLEVNALKGKQLTNIRTTSKDEAVRLTTPKKLTLEQSLGYIADDEYVEVTPKSIRLRKIWLDPNDRKRMSRASKTA
jgi:GTP-binding protein